jgi:hypothetical protein
MEELQNIVMYITISVSIISFLIFIWYWAYEDDTFSQNHSFTGFLSVFFLSLFLTVGLGFVTYFVILLLVIFWKILLIYVLPIILLSYLIFQWKTIINFFKTKRKNKKSKKIVNSVIDELKASELAQQVYNSLKNEMPDLTLDRAIEMVERQYGKKK